MGPLGRALPPGSFIQIIVYEELNLKLESPWCEAIKANLGSNFGSPRYWAMKAQLSDTRGIRNPVLGDIGAPLMKAIVRDDVGHGIQQRLMGMPTWDTASLEVEDTRGTVFA